MNLLTILFFVRVVVSFVATPLPLQTDALLMSTSASATVNWVMPTTICTATSEPTLARSEDKPLSALMTIAPLPQYPLEKRQCCYNDQGFQVDCAQWTGYYYTWGPAGNPYEGGPECGQSGSGSGGNGGSSPGTVVVYSNSGAHIDLASWSAIFGTICLAFLVFI